MEMKNMITTVTRIRIKSELYRFISLSCMLPGEKERGGKCKEHGTEAEYAETPYKAPHPSAGEVQPGMEIG
jgi:hypothetical protein